MESYTRLRESAAWFPVTDDSLIELTGEDRIEWLQGQCTNDLRKLKSNEPLYCCICTPTGQLAAPCTVYDLPDRLLIVTPKLCAPAVLERVETMVIMEDVQARDLTEEYDWVSIQGPLPASSSGAPKGRSYHSEGQAVGAALEDIAAFFSESPEGARDAPSPGPAPLIVRADRIGAKGYDILLRKQSKPLEIERLASNAALDIARLEAGIPIFGRDMTEKTLPPEMGPAFEAKYISYTKGCYTGQEVLMRIHSRGHTNKTWMALIADAPVSSGDAVSHSSRQDAGIVTSAAISPNLGPIAGAMLRNEAAVEGETVEVNTPNGPVLALVKHFPLYP